MNKIFILVCAAAFVTTCANAQTSAGSMMVGGGIEFTSVSYEGGSTNERNEVTFSPAFGYFINDNLAIGTSLTLSSGREGTGSNKTVTSSFGLGPFVRYYKFTSNESFAFFGQAVLSFQTGKTDPAAGGVTKNSAVQFSVAPGAAYFFNEHWALELSIAGFIFSSYDPNKNNDNDKINRVELGLNSLSPSVGFRYHF